MSLSLLACGGLEGEPGPAGPPGPSGPRGEDGADGMALATIYTCNNLQQVGTHRLAFNSVRYDFADGTVMTTCIVNDPLTSYSNTFLYRKDQPGENGGNCLVVYDLDNGTEGNFQFAASAAGVGAARYVDPTSSLNGTTVNLNCVKR